MDNITMNKKERDQLFVFKKLKIKEITQDVAAKMLGFTTRWIRKKMKRFLKFGDIGLVHKSRGKPSKKSMPNEYKTMIIQLLETEFKGFGPTFATEKLEEFYKIKVSCETMRKFMISNNFWTAKIQKTKHRKWRERKACLGIMEQLDGSPHDWFQGRLPKCTLLVFIDDATSSLMWLEFVKSESFNAVSGATKNYMQKCGRPISFYVDFGSVFSVNTNNPEREKITQYERICVELGVELIHARSPQAKGRVERANQTLQDRLVKEMSLRKISSIEEANKFAQGEYLTMHNHKFAVVPASQTNAHRSIEEFDLKNIFCIKNARILHNNFTIAYNNKILQLHDIQKVTLRPKDKITIHEDLEGQITLFIRKIQLAFTHVATAIRHKISPADYVRLNKEEEDLCNEKNTGLYPCLNKGYELFNENQGCKLDFLPLDRKT